MDLRTLIPLAPAALRPVLRHVLDRFEALERRIAELERKA
jgi:hypothetical protein